MGPTTLRGAARAAARLPPSAAGCLVPSGMACASTLRASPTTLLQDFVITDTLETFESDADMQRIRDGATLVVTSAANRALAAPASERISFQPHPKTLTMAGEFEYFAAQVCAQQQRRGGQALQAGCYASCLRLPFLPHPTLRAPGAAAGPSPLCVCAGRVCGQQFAGHAPHCAPPTLYHRLAGGLRQQPRHSTWPGGHPGQWLRHEQT